MNEFKVGECKDEEVHHTCYLGRIYVLVPMVSLLWRTNKAILERLGFGKKLAMLLHKYFLVYASR